MQGAIPGWGTKIPHATWRGQKNLKKQKQRNKKPKKMWYIHTMEYHTALKKKEILSHTTTAMNLEDIILSELSQLQNDKYYVIPLI